MPARNMAKLPSSFAMYPKVLANSLKKKTSKQLPDLSLTLNAVSIDRQHVNDYNTVCGFTQSDILAPTYLHMLVMPLQMALMVEESFPFPMLGLVHIANKITQLRPVKACEKVNITCRFGELKPHDKGQQFTLLADVYVGNEVVWSEETIYLFRQAVKSAEGAAKPEASKEKAKPVCQALMLSGRFRVILVAVMQRFLVIATPFIYTTLPLNYLVFHVRLLMACGRRPNV